MNLELVGALNELEKERGISRDILFEAIEAAVVSAYKRNYGNTLNVRVDLNDKTGQVRVFARKDVVDEVLDEPNEISLAEAKAIDPNFELDDIVEIEVTPRDFGRIAAQTAKQVVIQRIREAERALIYEEYSNREGDIVTGIVQRQEYRNVLIDLGKVEAVLPAAEQTPRENYAPNMRLKVYVAEVRKTTKGPQVFVSRSHPGLLKRLFELEVPEIHDGIVEIKAVTREAGNRSKIAVHTNDRNVDPVGACVGPRGMRVQTVVQELRGEKIDIVAWDALPDRFIANALSPARVVRVVVDPFEKSARAIVPDHQLSLAIGKEGQNARLAARLTGWKIDIKSESQMRELVALEAMRPKEASFLGSDTVADDSAVIGDTVGDEYEVEIDPAFAAVDGDTDEAVPGETYADDALDIELEIDLDDEVDHDDAFDADYDEYEADEDEADDEDPIEVEEPAAPAKPRRRRAEKRDELQDLLEEVETLEEEPLPSLFAEGDDPEEADGPLPSVPAPAPAITPRVVRRAKREQDPAPSEDKRVLKDLSELAKLIKEDEKD